MTQLDQLIDDVARRMVDESPSADFTARTMGRVRVQRRMRLWWGLVPLGAAAGVAIAVAAAMFQQVRPVRVPIVGPPGVPAIPTADAVPNPLPEIAFTGAAAAPRRSLALGPSAEELAWQSRRLPQLRAPAPIETESIQPAPLALPLLELKPLVTEPLIVEPLDGGK